MIYEVTTDLQYVKSKINYEAFLYLDVETKKFFSQTRLVQLFQSGWDKAIIIDIDEVDLMDTYQIIKDANVVAHNMQYEATCFYKDLGSFAKFKNWDCTMIASRLALHQLEKHSLDHVMDYVYRKDVYKEAGLDKKTLQKSGWKGKLSEDQLTYAAMDVYYLPKVWERVLKHRESFVYKLDQLTINHMVQFQMCGMPVDEVRLQELREEAEATINEMATNLPAGFNCNSYRQVRSYLNTEDSDDLGLAKIIALNLDDKGERAEWVRVQRKAKKKISFIKKFEGVDRIHGHFNVATRSGRSNCSEQNLQQLPSSLKSAFATKKYMVYADFSNLELRTFCAFINEPVMVQLFRDGVDLHTYVASKLFNCTMEEVTKKQRTIAKIFNFSSLYGAGVRTRLSILLKLTGIYLEEAEGARLAKMWLNIFPAIKPWQTQNADNWRKGETGYTALGKPYTAKLFTDQNNIMIQGSGGEVAKLAIHYQAKEQDIKAMCNFVHDSFTYEYDTLDEAKACAKIVAHSMVDSWHEVGKNFEVTDLPMPVKACVGHNWDDLQEEENMLYVYEIKDDQSIEEHYYD